MAYISFQPHDHFNTKLYTGNAGTNAITGVGFQPDWLWVKARNRTDSHRLIDVLRGTNTWKTNTASSEADASGDGFTSLDSDGFTLNGSGGGGEFNASGGTFAAWNWKAGGAGSTNTDGNMNTTVTVSANTTAGFSIIKWTGSGNTVNNTIGHGLGVAPKWVMVKNLTDAQAGTIGNHTIGWTKALDISSSGVENSSSTYWNNTAPSSSVVTLGSSGDTNGTGDSMIAYCFTEKNGFSRFGKYMGNGNANGTYVHLGFKPAMFLTKRNDGGAENWNIYDNKRGGDGAMRKVLYADTNDDEENKTGGIDFLASGVKMRGTDGAFNGSGYSYEFMAFAEEPLVSSNGIAATAGFAKIG